jgi:hypothetical protein
VRHRRGRRRGSAVARRDHTARRHRRRHRPVPGSLLPQRTESHPGGSPLVAGRRSPESTPCVSPRCSQDVGLCDGDRLGVPPFAAPRAPASHQGRDPLSSDQSRAAVQAGAFIGLEMHLSSVYLKRGVANRAQFARVMATRAVDPLQRSPRSRAKLRTGRSLVTARPNADLTEPKVWPGGRGSRAANRKGWATRSSPSRRWEGHREPEAPDSASPLVRGAAVLLAGCGGVGPKASTAG